MPGNGSRAKSKLKELLSGLDLDVSGGLGLDEDELALSEKDGLSERTTDFGGSDFSDTISESTDRDYRPMGRQPHSRSHVTANKYMLMEQRMMQVMRESKNMQQKYEKQLKERDLEISELQAHLNSAVKELDTRQKEIETRAPIFKLKLDEFREKLKDLRISDAQYEDLRRMPPEGLHIVDEVKVAVYASTADLKKENENLRLTLTSLRETSARAEEDAGQCRSDAARATAALVDKEKDMQTATSALKARVDRLASDLEQAMVRAELNSAKGTLYDELRAKTEKWPTRGTISRSQVGRQAPSTPGHRWSTRHIAPATGGSQAHSKPVTGGRQLALAPPQVVEATYKRLELEHRERETMWSRKEHTLEMLMMDKAYLSKQVDFLTDQLRKLDSDLEGKEQKASTHADLERIRVETAEAYEREARLLRELRDQASDEASRAKVSLSELQNLHEKSGLNWSEQHRKMDSRLSELNSEIRQKAFELGHLKVVLGEKDSLLHRANINAEMHQEKMNMLIDRYRVLEVERLVLSIGVSKRGAHKGSTPSRLHGAFCYANCPHPSIRPLVTFFPLILPHSGVMDATGPWSAETIPRMVLMDRYRALEAEHLVLATGVSRGPQDPPHPLPPPDPTWGVLMDRYRALEAEHLVLATGVSRGPQDPPPPALPGVLPASSSMAGMGQMQQEDLLLRLQVEKEALSAQASMLQTQLRAAQVLRERSWFAANGSTGRRRDSYVWLPLHCGQDGRWGELIAARDVKERPESFIPRSNWIIASIAVMRALEEAQLCPIRRGVRPCHVRLWRSKETSVSPLFNYHHCRKACWLPRVPHPTSGVAHVPPSKTAIPPGAEATKSRGGPLGLRQDRAGGATGPQALKEQCGCPHGRKPWEELGATLGPGTGGALVAPGQHPERSRARKSGGAQVPQAGRAVVGTGPRLKSMSGSNWPQSRKIRGVPHGGRRPEEQLEATPGRMARKSWWSPQRRLTKEQGGVPTGASVERSEGSPHCRSLKEQVIFQRFSPQALKSRGSHKGPQHEGAGGGHTCPCTEKRLESTRAAARKSIKDHEQDSMPRTRLGTIHFVAPEILKSRDMQPYDARASDIWACGVILAYMVLGYHPFVGPGIESLESRKMQMQVMAHVVEGKLQLPVGGIEGVSQEVIDLLKQMLNPDPKSRITVKEIMTKPWFVQNLPEGAQIMNEMYLKCPVNKPRQTAEDLASILAYCIHAEGEGEEKK
eukprot:gene6402-3016_t